MPGGADRFKSLACGGVRIVPAAGSPPRVRDGHPNDRAFRPTPRGGARSDGALPRPTGRELRRCLGRREKPRACRYVQPPLRATFDLRVSPRVDPSRDGTGVASLLGMRNREARPDTTTGGAVEPLERLVAETELLGALRFDGRGRVLTCNATMARLLGRSPDELTGATLGEVLDAPDAAAMLALVRGGHSHVSGRVRLAFMGKARAPFVLECGVAVDGSGGALLGSCPSGLAVGRPQPDPVARAPRISSRIREALPDGHPARGVAAVRGRFRGGRENGDGW